MIKAKKGKMLIVGLSDINLKNLQKDMPLKFNMKDIGFDEDVDVFIFHGATEQKMFEMMKGAIHPTKTILKSDKAKDN